MLQRVRNGSIHRIVLPLVLVLGVALVGLWRFAAVSSTQADDPFATHDGVDRRKLDKLLADAIRAGNSAQLHVLLEQGADANARDDAGDTMLMRAALYADADSMRDLINRGADVRARGRDGTPALLRTTHNLEKMRLLLDKGAPVDDFAMLAAASVPGSRSALELLFAHGGNCRAAGPAYSSLMAAAGNGDVEAVQCLLDHGADARAKSPTGFTALIAGALSGNAKVVALLLERGADPNAVCELERGILQTPAGVAASMGHADCLRLLMSAGADVNVQGGPFNHCALLGAATTPSKETMQLLLAKAHVNAKDWNGNTALDWALRRGETDIVQLLRDAKAKQTKPVSQAEKNSLQRHRAEADSVQRAVSAALPLLQQSEQTITQSRSCVSCHQHPLVQMTVGLARKHGFKVDETIDGEERSHIQKDMEGRARPLLLGTGIDTTLSVHVLAGMAAEDEALSRVTDVLVHYLVLRQRTDGHWQQDNYRPPDEASNFQFTALAVRGLQVYTPEGRKREIATRIERARHWLESTKPVDTTDLGFQLLGLGWAGAAPGTIKAAVTNLIAEQREDGGWAQLTTLASDAYATGLALCALHEGGRVPTEDPAYRRGVEFLLRSQFEDGSWYVASRSFPIVDYSKSGFPHGRSQFISAAATCWATMALSLTTPELPQARPPLADVHRVQGEANK